MWLTRARNEEQGVWAGGVDTMGLTTVRKRGSSGAKSLRPLRHAGGRAPVISAPVSYLSQHVSAAGRWVAYMPGVHTRRPAALTTPHT